MFQDDQQFWFETLRNLGLAVYGGSDVGEVVATASDWARESNPLSMSFTQGDSSYWSGKVTAGTVRVWDETRFRGHLAAEADRLQEGEDVRELLEMADFHSETLAREAIAGADIDDLYFPEEDLGDFYVLNPLFIRALTRARQGLALYADRQS